MEDILELILSIIFMPFEDKIDDLINRIPSKPLRNIVMILMILVAAALFFGLVCLCNYIFRGYWI